MSDIDTSTRRLEVAVDRLAAAAEQRGRDGALAAADRQRLERELAALRADFARLRETSTGVAARLDAAIGRLKPMLEDGA